MKTFIFTTCFEIYYIIAASCSTYTVAVAVPHVNTTVPLLGWLSLFIEPFIETKVVPADPLVGLIKTHDGFVTVHEPDAFTSWPTKP